LDTKAVFTIVRNEKVFLPIWLKYYSKYFNKEDIYILDNDTTDGSTDGLNTVKVSSEVFLNSRWLRRQVTKMQRKLLKKYDIVLFAECDEIIVPLRTGRFEDHLVDGKPVVKCTGFEIIHRIREEPEIDWSKPLLEQRKYGSYFPKFNKPLLSRIPLTWSMGFHYLRNYENDEKVGTDPMLMLVHLRRIDYNTCKKKFMERIKWRTIKRMGHRPAKQWRPGTNFDHWFTGDSTTKIPGNIKHVI